MTLAKLELEMEYLREQIDETEDAYYELESAEAEILEQGRENVEDNWMEWVTLRRDKEHLRERLELLRPMRTERMRESETVKLEYETQRRMQGR